MTKALTVKEPKSVKPIIKAVDGKINVEVAAENYSTEQLQKSLVGVSGDEAFNKLLNQAIASCNHGSSDDKLNSIMPLLFDI